MVNSRSPFFTRYRWKELGLLIIPFLILMVGMIQLLLVQGNVNTRSTFNAKYLPPLQALIPIFGFIGVLLTANLVMSIRFRKADQVLLPLVGLLTGIGVLMATRLGPDINISNLGSLQLLYALIGIIVCLLTIFFLRDTSVLSRYKYTWAIASLAFMIPSFISGVLSFHSGAPTHDQISLGFITLQPSEFLKITIVIFFAGYLSENREILSQGYLSLGKLRLPPLRQLGPMVLMLLVALMFFLIVRELGIALLIYGLFLCLTYLGSGNIRYVLVYLGIFALLGYIGYALLSYVRARFATVSIDVVNWTPASEQAYQSPDGAFQVVQGLIALSSGGILGAGLGQGHPWLVPVVQSDMVWTALGEELGLAGMMAIIGIYLFIVYRGFRIAIEASDPFNQLLAAGLTSIFALQTLLIAAGNMKFMPLTGMPLPFISTGGSSLFTNFIIIGILLRISYNTALEREGLA
jgi:cell division protein FtsW (lipid II flippase)